MCPRGSDFTKLYQANIRKEDPPLHRISSGMDRNSCEGKIRSGGEGSSFEYEHFPVVCPTCQGLGEICDEGINFILYLCSFLPNYIV